MLPEKDIRKVQKALVKPQGRISFVLQALADPTRLNIFRLFAEKKDLCVTDLSRILDISLPAVSYQLKLMELAGLVKKKRNGRMICYELKKEDPLISRMTSMIAEVES